MLPEASQPDKVDKTDDPEYCAYQRMISNLTSSCYILKDQIQP